MIQLKALINAVRGKNILIDSNVIIYLTEEIHPYFSLSRELFSMIENGDAAASISILSVAEVMQGPIKAGNDHLAQEVRNYLFNFPNCNCLDITYEVLQLVGNDPRISWKTLRSIDSLIIATGLRDNVDLFVSNDHHFKKSLPSNLLLAFE